MFPDQAPLFARINADELIPVVITVIGIIAWLVKHLSSSKPNEVAPVPRPRPRPNANLESEIQEFLGEVNSGQREQPKRPQRQAGGGRPPQPRKTPPKPPARKPVERLQPVESGDVGAATQKKRQLGRDILDREGPGARDLGVGIREHVSSSAAAPRVQAQVEADLAPRVAESVTHHLGRFEALQQEADAKRQRSALLEQLFSSRENLKAAVIMTTVLSRPRAFRRTPAANAVTDVTAVTAATAFTADTDITEQR
jgi:hypothetical protein